MDKYCGNCDKWGKMKSGEHFQVDEMKPKKICSVVGVFVAPDFAGPKCTEWKFNWNLELGAGRNET